MGEKDEKSKRYSDDELIRRRIFTYKDLAEHLGVKEQTVKGYTKHERGSKKFELIKYGFAVKKLGLTYEELLHTKEILDKFKDHNLSIVDILKFKDCIEQLKKCENELNGMKEGIKKLACSQ